MQSAKTSFIHKCGLLLIGFLLSIIILEVVLRLSGFVFLKKQEWRNQQSLSDQKIRILCIGESTTALGNNDAYPTQLEEILNQNQDGLKFSVINKGIPATNTTYILSQIENWIERYRPHIVISMMGVNDEIYGDEHLKPFNPREEHKPYVKRNTRSEWRVVNLLKMLGEHLKAKTEEIHSKEVVGFAQGYAGQLRVFDQYSALSSDQERKLMREGLFYRDINQFEDAHKRFEAVLRSNNLDSVLLEVGLTYFYDKKFEDAREVYLQALELNPLNPETYFRLAITYGALRDYVRMEKMLLRTISLGETDISVWMELVTAFKEQGKTGELGEIYSRAAKANPNHIWGYAGMKQWLRDRGDMEKYKAVNDVIQNLYVDSTFETTVQNYKQLVTLLKEKDIQLMAMQYALRPVAALRAILDDHDEVIFINNESTFERALQEQPSHAIFTDFFAGDFGHCTRLGNQLIAQNAADAVKLWIHTRQKGEQL